MTYTKPTNSLATDIKDLSQLKQGARQNSPEAVKEAAKKFEALFVNMMLKTMRDSIPTDGVFDSEQSKTFTSMLDQQWSQSIAGRGIGLADVLAKQLSNNQSQSRALTPEVAPNKDAKIEPGATSNHKQTFVDRVGGAAQRASAVVGVSAEYLVAQAALESGWGSREIKNKDGSSSHNLFGVKAGSSWKGSTVDVVTTEYKDGVPQKIVQKFRSYASDAEAFQDYAQTISSSSRYKGLSEVRTPDEFAQVMQRSGYATDPEYGAKLKQLIGEIGKITA
jgi:flagellar protein FlgJ